jgi:hypothetical protein
MGENIQLIVADRGEYTRGDRRPASMFRAISATIAATGLAGSSGCDRPKREGRLLPLSLMRVRA